MRPEYFNDFFSHFETLFKRHNKVFVFDDFLTIFYAQLVPYKLADVWHKKAVKRYNPTEKVTINKLYRMTLELYRTQGQKQGWFDLFGELHSITFGEELFPSPDVFNEQAKQYPLSIQKKYIDSNCGSGRLILALHAKNPNNFFFGESPNLLFCKMAAVNMAMHGITGEVIHHNPVLNPESFENAWTINSDHHYRAIRAPHIIPFGNNPEDSVVCGPYVKLKAELEKKGTAPREIKKELQAAKLRSEIINR